MRPETTNSAPGAADAGEDREEAAREHAAGLMAAGVCLDMASALAVAESELEAEERERERARREAPRPRHHPRARPRQGRTVIV